jgi:hypothetical protein
MWLRLEWNRKVFRRSGQDEGKESLTALEFGGGASIPDRSSFGLCKAVGFEGSVALASDPSQTPNRETNVTQTVSLSTFKGGLYPQVLVDLLVVFGTNHQR